MVDTEKPFFRSQIRTKEKKQSRYKNQNNLIMKNLTILFALGLILFTSCSKDDSLEQTELQTIDSVYVLNQFAGSAAWESMLIDQSQNSANLAYSINNGIDAHTDGYYAPTSRDAMTIVWSGTQNGSGARRGSATIKQSTPNFSFHLDLETECITMDGNQAVYGGTITQVRTLTGNAPPIGIGWRFYFKVTDSENRDQIANTTIFASPMSPSLCNAYLPNQSNVVVSRNYSCIGTRVCSSK